MKRRFLGGPTLILAVAVSLAVTAPRAHAGGSALSNPCNGVVSQLREAPAHPAPFHVGDPIGDLGFEYGRWEADLERDLVSASSAAPDAPLAGITAACRAEIRRGAAPAAVAAARSLTEKSEPGLVEYGHMVLCAMQDPRSTQELQAWMGDGDHPGARALCVAALATWPDVGQQRKTILAGVVRKTGVFTWEVDPAVVAAANVFGGSELLEQLVPVLADAHRHHALGYDRLRVAVCAHDDSTSGSRARACSTLPVQAEHEWRRTGVRPWLTRGALTAGYGGAIALTYATRDREVSRGFATASGVVGGFVTGIAAVYFGGKAVNYDVDHPHIGFEALMVAGVVAGSVLGGIGAYTVAAPSGARAPVTAAGLAPLYILAFEATFE
jgi:hypothetical protein